MPKEYLNYLEREHSRLENEIERELKRVRPDQIFIARLKKLKLAVKDQIFAIESGDQTRVA